MPNHIDELSNKEDTTVNTIIETTPAERKILKPLGDLSIFPREIRDEIYRHVFPSMYKAFYSFSITKPALSEYYSLFRVDYDREWRNTANLSILRLSKAITDEAMPFLYSEGIFCFDLEPSPKYHSKIPQHPKVDILNQITNLKVSYLVGLDLMWDSRYSYASAPVGPLFLFQGDSITRNSFLIDLRLCECSPYAIDLSESPLFSALRKLTGFKTVTLRLTATSVCYYPLQGTSRATISEWVDTEQWEKVYAGLEPLLRAISKALEPALGNSSAISDLESKNSHLLWSGQRHVVFHPQDHIAAITKAERDAMKEQQTMCTMRIN